MSKPTTQITPTERERLEIEVARATADDVATVRDLLLQHFGYIYITLLGNSKEQASKILGSMLKANGGRHPLGYKSFYVARLRCKREETAGILRLKTKSTAQRFDTLFGGLSIIKILLQNLGPRGTFRTLRTWWVIRDIAPEVEADELHIVYLAVGDNALKRQVGKQLLEYAKTVAAGEGKKFISLYVRAKNVKAQGFFLSQGFSVVETVADTVADNLLKQGASIRMIAPAPTLKL